MKWEMGLACWPLHNVLLVCKIFQGQSHGLVIRMSIFYLSFLPHQDECLQGRQKKLFCFFLTGFPHLQWKMSWAQKNIGVRNLLREQKPECNAYNVYLKFLKCATFWDIVLTRSYMTVIFPFLFCVFCVTKTRKEALRLFSSAFTKFSLCHG